MMVNQLLLSVGLALAFSTASLASINTRSEDVAKDDFQFAVPKEIQKSSKSLMYPYEDKDYVKEIQHLYPFTRRVFNFEIPFYGFYYNYSLISVNGYISFGSSRSAFIPTKYPQSYPDNRWPQYEDPAMIAAFCMDAEIGQVPSGGLRAGVYMRVISAKDKNSPSEDKELLKAVSLDIREGMIGATDFDPKYLLIFTWRNMTFKGGINKSVTNTYQIVLATDEVRSYVIFNYDRLKWTSSTESMGDTTTGLGGISAFVGFNGGNRTSAFEYKPYSQSAKILQLLTEGRSNSYNGRHIFRVDEEIVAGSCNSGTGHSGKLVMSPDRGHMLGGTVVNITGPCFTPNKNFTLRIHDKEIICSGVTPISATCVTPKLFTVGYVQVAMSFAIGQPVFKSMFYIENPLLARDEVKVSRINSLNSLELPPSIELNWNISNLAADRNARVNINLYGYRETENNFHLQLLARVAVVPNNGRYILNTTNLNNFTHKMNLDYTMGLFGVNVSNPSNNINGDPAQWSRPIPLGWFLKNRWEELLGEGWPAVFCNNWLENERRLENFAAMLPKCPCSLATALVDKGPYAADFECDLLGNNDCSGKQRTVQCVRLGQPTVNGTDQHCCYNASGSLLLPNITLEAGRSARVHPFGSYPYDQARKVPGLSHWYHDRMPFLFCCNWQNKNTESCQVYQLKRPSQDCTGYNSSVPSLVYGDPHFITFDDFEYSFNANGEYTLLKATKGETKLNIQGRFERVLKVDNRRILKLNATQLTAVAMAESNSAVVEVRMRQSDAKQRYKLTVLVDNRTIYFDSTNKRMQYYKGVTVYVPGNILNQSQVITVFQSGAAVEVLESKQQIVAIVYLPKVFKFRTAGLLGNYSKNPNDDLTLPFPQSPLPFNSSTETIYKEFKTQWVVGVANSTEKSLFFEEFKRNSTFYYNNTFKPVFEEPWREDLDYWWTRVCGSKEMPQAKTCRFDYAVTEDENFAKLTKYFRDRFQYIRERLLRD